MAQTNTEEMLGFTRAEASPMPTLICVGVVGAVGEGKISSTEKYIVQPIDVEGLDAGRNQRVYWLYRPEWLVKGFKPSKLKEVDEGAYFVYSKNIDSEDAFSVLRGLAGSQQAFERISNALLRLPVAPGTNGPSIQDVEETLREFFNDNLVNGEPARIGYILQQDAVKTDEVDETTGKNIYMRTKRYKVLDWFDVTMKNLKFQANRANKSEGRLRYTYSNEVPF